ADRHGAGRPSPHAVVPRLDPTGADLLPRRRRLRPVGRRRGPVPPLRHRCRHDRWRRLGSDAMTEITTPRLDSSTPEILVVGASGATGLAVVRALHRRGAPVRALIRDAAKDGLVRAAGARD